MRLAILGIRGVPANYGGFETFAEELGSRLAERGHEVTVYGRDRYVARGLTTYRGMRLVRLPAPRSKYLETVIHSLFSAIHALCRSYDVVYICNSANVPAAILLRRAWAEGRPQRGRPRVAAGEMGRGGARLLPRVRMARRAPAVPGRHRCARHPGLLPLDVRPRDRRSSHTARTWAPPPMTARSPASVSSPTLRPVCQPARAREQRSRGDRGLWPVSD